MTHTHHKWDCPKSNGRHEWEWDPELLLESCKLILHTDPNLKNSIGIPVHCKYGCGTYGTEWYKFEELIEGK